MSEKMKENQLSTLTDRKIFFLPLGLLLNVLNNICTCAEPVHLYVKVYVSSHNVHLPSLLLYVRVSQGRLQLCSSSGHPREKKNSERLKKTRHIFTRSICGSQAAGKAEEDEEAEEVAVSFLYQSLSFSLSLSQPRRSSWSFCATFSSSDSMAARLSISGSCREKGKTAYIYICVCVCTHI